MSKAAKWAVIRNEAPVMPWEGKDSMGDRSIFRRIAAVSGTAFALKFWNDSQALFLNAPPEGDPAVVEYCNEFTARLADRDGEEYADTFWRMFHAVRLQAWGMRKELEAQP